MLRELRFAFRRLRKSPGFTLVALLLLTIGIGSNAAIFSVVNAVLLGHFPYHDPDRLVLIWERNPQLGSFIGERIPTVYPNFKEWKEQGTAFESMAGMEDAPLNRTDGPSPERVVGARVTANFFSVLGVQPGMGVSFDSAAQSNNTQVVMLSYNYYQSHYGNANPLGRTMTLNDAVYTIIGVLPPEFYLPSTREGGEQRKPEAWIPYDLAALPKTPDYLRRKIQVFARLKPGVSLEEARSQMNIITARLAQENPNLNSAFASANVFPLYVEDTGKELRLNLLILLGAVGFVLLIVCSNIASLMLSRALARQKELAVRRALGASNRELLPQVWTESAVLSFIGGLFGLGFAWIGIKGLLALNPEGIRRPEQIHLSLSVVVFTFAVAAISAMLAAIAPALQVLRTDLAPVLQRTSGGHVTGGSRMLRSIMVVFEVAVAVVLVTGSAFMMRSLLAVMNVDPGFRPDHVLTMRIELPSSRYPNPDDRAAFCRRVTEAVIGLPGIKAAAFSDGLPLTRLRMMRFLVEGQPTPKPGAEPTADMRGITTPDYLDSIGLPLVEGRNFTALELQQHTYNILINQSLARKLWKGQSAVGKHLYTPSTKPGDPMIAWTVIGVVRDTKQMSLEASTRPEVTRAMLDYTVLTLSVRTSGDPGSATAGIRNLVASIDKDLPLFDVRSMQDIVDDSIGQRRFNSFLITVFAGAALLLSAIGLYGLLMSLVAQQTQEIGIRVALGAQHSDVLRLVFRQGLKLVAIGLGIGLVASIVLMRVFSSQLFGVTPTEPLEYLEVLTLMLLTALLAIYLPARRAVNVDPLTAIREQ